MRFTLTTERRFRWPVTVRLPSAEAPGQVDEQAFNGHFRLLSEDEAHALGDTLRTAGDARAQVEASKAQIRAMLIGWDEDVTDDAGRPVAFSADALERAMELSAFRAAVLRAYAAGVAARPAEGN